MQTARCAAIVKVMGTPGMKVPMEISNSSFVKADYTWANIVDVLFRYDIALLLANKSITRMEPLHDHLESKRYSPTSMVCNVTAWMHLYSTCVKRLLPAGK